MSDLDSWLRDQKDTLDQAIADACEAAFSAGAWSEFELEQTREDTYRLSGGRDCFYDRPSIAPTYASWYHPRRLHQLVRLLRPWCDNNASDTWTVLDLGCGTGATLWAFALLACGMRQCGLTPPQIDLRAIDSSPFMTDFAQNAWENHFLKAYPDAKDFVSVDFPTNNWMRHTAFGMRSRPLVIAGYLFDHSDRAHAKEIAGGLKDFATRHRASRLLVLSAQSKENVVDSAIRCFHDQAWTQENPAIAPHPLWHGCATACTHVRHNIYRRCSSITETGQVTWDRDKGFYAAARVSTRHHQDNLFHPETPPRIRFDDAQEKAAQPSPGRIKIFGAAGSGKSLVLAERIARTLSQANNAASDTRVLVTAFNKAMLDQLKEWIHARLKDHGDASSECWIQKNDSGWWSWDAQAQEGHHIHMTIINWDRAPTRLLHIKEPRSLDTDNTGLSARIDKIRQKHGLSPSEFTDISTPEFLRAEKQRVKYGLAAIERDTYLSIERTGRGSQGERRLQKNARSRAFVWDAMNSFSDFADRKINALRAVRGNTQVPQFDHVFVDECQDFTRADMEILEHLNGWCGSIVLAGDPTQSMHMGPSHSTKLPPDRGSVTYRTHKLLGSYRIPLRICECLRPLAATILSDHELADDESGISPETRKAAVPGIRPILVVYQNKANLSEQVRMIAHEYGENKVTVAEEDPSLCTALGIPNTTDKLRIECASMRKIKGLERSFVVWSTRIPLEIDEAVDEWVYTILSRTTRLLVIAIGQDSQPDLLELVKKLERDRLLPWTREAKQRMDRWTREAKQRMDSWP